MRQHGTARLEPSSRRQTTFLAVQEYNVLYSVRVSRGRFAPLLAEEERGALSMELAWNTQKNGMSDVKGKEMEQERKGEISNPDIDLSKSHMNYDIVQSDLNLYQRVKSRVDELKASGSRVQKNSVVDYSNILTVPKEQAEIWGEEKTAAYFKSCYDFFCDEFGKENVVSAKVHLDETAPHMHLHFVPVNKENGKLQARVAMNKEKINYIHDELPKFLQERDFDVVRGNGKTVNNIDDIHEYKEIQKMVEEKKQELNYLEEKLETVKDEIGQADYDLRIWLGNLDEVDAKLVDWSVELENAQEEYNTLIENSKNINNYTLEKMELFKIDDIDKLLYSYQQIKAENNYLKSIIEKLKEIVAGLKMFNAKEIVLQVKDLLENLLFKKTETFEEFSEKLNRIVKSKSNKFTERLETAQRELQTKDYVPKKDYWKEEYVVDRSIFKK